MRQPLARFTRLFLASSLLAGLTLCWADDPGSPVTPSLSGMGGEQIYKHVCQGCHMAQGQGAIGASYYPRLAKDRALASWRYVALTILGGKNDMPSFGSSPVGPPELGFTPPASSVLSDAQIADAVHYVRTHFGNRYRGHVTPAQVAELRPLAAR